MKTCDTTSPCLTRNGKVGGPTAPPAKRQKTSSSSSSSAVAPVFSSTRCDNLVPVEVWKEHICQKYLNPTELSILRRCHTFFEKYWQNVMAQKVMRVQVQVPGYPVPRAVAWRAPTTPRHQAQLRQIIEYSQYTLDGMSSLRVGHSISQKKKKRRNINFYLLLVWVVVPYTKLPVACLYCGQTTCIVKHHAFVCRFHPEMAAFLSLGSSQTFTGSTATGTMHADALLPAQYHFGGLPRGTIPPDQRRRRPRAILVFWRNLKTTGATSKITFFQKKIGRWIRLGVLTRVAGGNSEAGKH